MDFSTRKTVKPLGFIALFLIVVLGYFVVISPLMAQSAKYSENYAQATSDKDTASSRLTTLQQQKSTIESVEKYDDELSVKFPGLADTPSLVASINKSATNSSLRASDITSVSTTVPSIVPATGGTASTPDAGGSGEDVAAAPAPNAGSAESGSLASIVVDITAEGSLDNLSKFTEEMTDNDRNMSITSVNLTSDGKKSSLSLKATTYIYKTVTKVGEEQETSAEETTGGAETPPTGN